MFAAMLASLAPPALAQAEYVLLLEYQTETETVESPSVGSGSGSQTLSERILSTGEAGTEIEYFLPQPAEEIRGNSMWMFPARVMVAADGTKTLLNSDELERRVDDWLTLGDWTRQKCGQWLFTWTAVQIRCDPQAAIEAIETYGLRPGRVAEGETVTLPGAAEPVLLRSAGTRGGRNIFLAEAPIDSDTQRLQAAEIAVVVASLSGDDKTLDQALVELVDFSATGTIRVEFEVDAEGLVWRRHDVTEMTVTGLEWGDEKRRANQTVSRHLSSGWYSPDPVE